MSEHQNHNESVSSGANIASECDSSSLVISESKCSEATIDVVTSDPSQVNNTPLKRMRMSVDCPATSALPGTSPPLLSAPELLLQLAASDNASDQDLSTSQVSGEVEEVAGSSQGAETEELEETDNLDELDEEEPEEEEEEEEDEEEEIESTVLGDDDAESVVSRLISSTLDQEREARKVEDRKLLALLAHFDEEQLNRFEAFRRATFAKTSVRRLIQSIASCTVSQNVVIAMAGLTKVFVGEIVEEALDYKERLGETGPLRPKHIREAYRVLSESSASCTSIPENPLK